MILEPLALEGAYLVHGYRMADERGWFWKNYQDTAFGHLGLEFECRETFFSMSSSGVLRGMHFQLPPKAHNKLVTCLSGEVFDVLLDMRKNSLTFGKAISVKLNSEGDVSVFVPIGLAHGFYVMTERAMMCYQTSIPYDPNSDSGVNWNSIAVDWPITQQPVLSERDQGLPPWRPCYSPF
ncbi:dTDP-4-dehydrorhamnose 3,5-epimerase [Dechloromonas sp. ZY10]|uniref:dTDP-4-dehydrorhamnose 3,5-epimerase n=1 Tax=Dechloromonas aquae TaxID=2664436 RepID=UPI003528347B